MSRLDGCGGRGGGCLVLLLYHMVLDTESCNSGEVRGLSRGYRPKPGVDVVGFFLEVRESDRGYKQFSQRKKKKESYAQRRVLLA